MKTGGRGAGRKSKKVVTVSYNESIASAASKMRESRVGCLVVTDCQGKLAGIVTERDIVRAAADKSQQFDKTAISEIMTREVISVPWKTHYQRARELMSAKHIRHLPIVKDGEAVGMFSIRDVMEQQLIQDRLAAEQVIMLSACIRSIDMDEVTHNIVSEVPKLFGARNCSIYLEGTCGGPKVCSNRCLCSQEHIVQELSGENLSGEQLNLFYEVPRLCEDLGAESPRLVIGLTIQGEKKVSGESEEFKGSVCMCGLQEAVVTGKELLKYKVKLVCDLLNAHLSNVWRYQDARIASMTDALTQVGSREFIEDKLVSECVRAKRYNHIFTVAMIDLDNFKTINDTLGHAVGDEALRRLASCMKEQVRRSDVLGRYGGDEFVIIMTETSAEQGRNFFNRLRSEIHKIKIEGITNLSISCGVAESQPGDRDSGRDVMKRADLALYEAKRAGKDCVKVWNEEMANSLVTNAAHFS